MKTLFACSLASFQNRSYFNYSGFIEAEQLVEAGGVASVKDYNEFKLEIEKLIYDKKNIIDKVKIISNYINSKSGALSVIKKKI